MNIELTWTLINGRSFNSLAAFPPELMTVASLQCAPPSWSLNHANGLLSCRLSWSTVAVPPPPAPVTSVDSGYSSSSSPFVSSPVPFRLSSDAVSFADAAFSTDEAVASPSFEASTPVHLPPVPTMVAHVIPPPPAFVSPDILAVPFVATSPTLATTLDTQVPDAPLPAEGTAFVDLVSPTTCTEFPPLSDGKESSHVTYKFPEDGSGPTGGQVSASTVGSPSAYGDAPSEPSAPPPTSTTDTYIPAPTAPLPAEVTATAVLVSPPVVPEVPPLSDGMGSSHVTNKFPEDGSCPTGGQVSASTVGSPSAYGDAPSDPSAPPTSTTDTYVPSPTAPLPAEVTATAVLVSPPVVPEVPPLSDGMGSSHVTNKFPKDGSCPPGGQVSASTVGSPSAYGDAPSAPPVFPTSTTDLVSASIACQTDLPPINSVAPPIVSSMGSQTIALPTADASTQATALPSASTSTSGSHVLLPQPSPPSSRSSKNKKKKKKGQLSTCAANSRDAATSYDPPGVLVRFCHLCHESDCVGSSALVHLLTCTDLPARILALRTTFFDQQAKRIGIPPAVLLTQSALFLTNHYLDDMDPEEFDPPSEDLIGQLLWSTFTDPVKIAAYIEDLRLLLRNLSTAILKHLQYPPNADINLLFCTRGCELLPRAADDDDPFYVNGVDPDAYHPFDDLYSADDPYLDDPYYGYDALSDELDAEEF